jgi:DNA-binding NarL/FixJ family response regulator
VLDIGLPKLNGLEAARQIRQLSPNSKILFLSQESSADVVQEALDLGAFAYVVKSDAGSELLTCVNAVLRGEKFVGGRFAGRDSAGTSDAPGRESLRHTNVARSFGNIHFKLSRARG